MTGVVTERALARRYIRESRQASTLQEAPTYVQAVAEVLEGELVCGEDRQLAGRVWVQSMDPSTESGISEGDIRRRRQPRGRPAPRDQPRRRADRLSNGSRPSDALLALARERSTAVIVSPLDTYVSGRMITLAAPCARSWSPTADGHRRLPARDISEQIKEIHYGAAIAIDGRRHPVGLVTRSDLVSPTRRRVVLVDHAEQAQSVPGSSRRRSSRSSTTTTSGRSRRGYR